MNVYEARHAGREYCNDTEGSEHYKQGDIEPLDIFISKGLAEDFCICNMVKYAIRFKKTRNLADLRKVSDYAQILCGVELGKTKEPYTTYLEEMGEEDVSEPHEQKFHTEIINGNAYSVSNAWKPTVTESVEPVKGKYDGLSNEELKDEIHKRVNPQDNISECPKCPLSMKNNPVGIYCRGFMKQFPEEFRKIAIDWLNKQDGLEVAK